MVCRILHIVASRIQKIWGKDVSVLKQNTKQVCVVCGIFLPEGEGWSLSLSVQYRTGVKGKM